MRILVAVALVAAAAPAGAQQPVRLRIEPPAGLDRFIPAPEDNPLRAPVVELGRQLFHEVALSADARIACASCHDPDRSFADRAPVSRGSRGARTRRNAPALINAAWSRSYFWDGRATSLEEQVLRPIEDPREMATRVDDVITRLDAIPAYERAFFRAFGTRPSRETLVLALASYVRTIMSGDSPADRYRAGDTTALDSTALAGYRLFTGRANCATCHPGATFSDQLFHNTGVAWQAGAPADSGRYNVTWNPLDIGAFRTPTLRDIEHTAPYMHDGSIATLRGVIDFYDTGGQGNPHLDPEIRPLHLTVREKLELEAYLRALGGRVVEGWPRNPRRRNR